MPKQVIEDAMVTLNSVDLSSRVKKVVIQTSKRTPQLVTAMQDTWEDRIQPQIRGWKGSLEFYQDFAAASVYASLLAILNSTVSSGVPLIVRPTTGIRTTGNPEWQGTVQLDGDFAQIDGNVGDALMVPVTFLGNGALSFFSSSS